MGFVDLLECLFWADNGACFVLWMGGWVFDVTLGFGWVLGVWVCAVVDACRRFGVLWGFEISLWWFAGYFGVLGVNFGAFWGVWTVLCVPSEFAFGWGFDMVWFLGVLLDL